MKKVLALGYSQTGQLDDIAENFLRPIVKDPHTALDRVKIIPERPYPFPWPFWRFFNTFPETVYEDVPPIAPLATDPEADYDLIILFYTVWFLSPSQPTTAFLQTDTARKLISGKPVITVIGCRNMWLMAQERMKEKIDELGGHLIDNVVLTDPTHASLTFISTPLWMLTGNKGPFLAGSIPKAGVSKADIDGCSRFGEAIARQLPERERAETGPMLEGLGAVTVSEGLMASEQLAKRSFKLWGGMLRAVGKPSSRARRALLVFYVVFLVTLILTVVPLSAALKNLLKPLRRREFARLRAYYAAPSGESFHLMEC